MPTLTELFRKYGCDKGDQPSEPWMWEGGMNYGPHYDRLFAPLQHRPVNFLELGWGEFDSVRWDHANPDNGGRSAKAWKDYFHPDSTLAFIDVEKKTNHVEGVLLFQGSQDDPDFLHHLHRQLGDWDIIIDDASHLSSLTIASFNILWPLLKPGGIYVVEDLHTSYHDWFEPYADDANQNPTQPCRNGQPTAMQYLKSMADEANYRGRRGEHWDCYPRQYWNGHSVDSVFFTYNLAVVTKSVNNYA